jgi:hypothetical protein
MDEGLLNQTDSFDASSFSTQAPSIVQPLTPIEQMFVDFRVPLFVLPYIPDSKAMITLPVCPGSTSFFTVSQISGDREAYSMEKDYENIPFIYAVKQPNSYSISGEFGDARLYFNDAKTSYWLVRNSVEELAVIFKKVIPGTQYKLFDVGIPSLDPATNESVKIDFEGISYLLRAIASPEVDQRVVKLSTKEPEFKEGRYVLIFNGRVKKLTKYNFILLHSHYPDREVLVFGKSSDEKFILDTNWPVSPLQAFGIALTLFSAPDKL